MLRIFISHSNSFTNHDFLDRLYKELKFYDIEIINQQYNYIYNEDVTGTLLNYIKKSDVFIAIFDYENSTVLLELGYAIGIGKPILITSSTEVELPPHLRNFSFINSNLRNIDQIDEIVVFLEKINKEKKEKENSIEDLQGADYNKINEMLAMFVDNPENMQNIDSHEFELLIFEWFRFNGFHPEWAEEKREYGFDFVIQYRDERILVDVKKFSPNSYVSVMKVQQLLGAVHAYHAVGGMIITSSGYTSSARDFAMKCSPKIELFNVKDILTNKIENCFL
ncbi:restriction endonuclease [Paenibacillus chitinolyticus]|uniref:restriction endonuclease n=1 Tax=Paenibacillus chitinolyticus TaxID=79263 RepID=UPI0036DF4A1C